MFLYRYFINYSRVLSKFWQIVFEICATCIQFEILRTPLRMPVTDPGTAPLRIYMPIPDAGTDGLY